MIGNLMRMDSVRLPGEAYDSVACFRAKDEHSDCMDVFQHLKGAENHYRCEPTLAAWKRACGPVAFRLQMEQREQAIRDNFLFDKAQLRDYVRRKERQQNGEPITQVLTPGKF